MTFYETINIAGEVFTLHIENVLRNLQGNLDQ